MGRLEAGGNVSFEMRESSTDLEALIEKQSQLILKGDEVLARRVAALQVALDEELKSKWLESNEVISDLNQKVHLNVRKNIMEATK